MTPGELIDMALAIGWVEAQRWGGREPAPLVGEARAAEAAKLDALLSGKGETDGEHR